MSVLVGVIKDQWSFISSIKTIILCRQRRWALSNPWKRTLTVNWQHLVKNTIFSEPLWQLWPLNVVVKAAFPINSAWLITLCHSHMSAIALPVTNRSISQYSVLDMSKEKSLRLYITNVYSLKFSIGFSPLYGSMWYCIDVPSFHLSGLSYQVRLNWTILLS